MIARPRPACQPLASCPRTAWQARCSGTGTDPDRARARALWYLEGPGPRMAARLSAAPGSAAGGRRPEPLSRSACRAAVTLDHDSSGNGCRQWAAARASPATARDGSAPGRAWQLMSFLIPATWPVCVTVAASRLAFKFKRA